VKLFCFASYTTTHKVHPTKDHEGPERE